MNGDDPRDRVAPGRPSYLLYRDRRDDRPRGAFVAQVFGGLMLSIVAVATCGVVFVLCNLDLRPIGAPRPPLQWRMPLVFSLCILLPLGGLTGWLAHRGNKGFLIGALIGFGVTALLEGLCFRK